MKIFITAILSVLLVLPASGQVPFTNWDFTLYARTTTMTDSLARLGIRSDATPDFDNAYDIPRPPRSPSGNYLELYFPHSGGGYPPLLGTRYATDFQDSVDPDWDFSVETSAGEPVTVSWDSSYVESIEPRLRLYLVDVLTGTTVDMRSVGRYVFNYTSKRDFRIVGAIKVNLTYLMEGFWNGATQVPDTIRGYLAETTGAHLFVDSARVHLSTSGGGMLVFPSAPTGNYYLVVRHRNHLETWSSTAQSLVKGTTSIGSYDFSAGPGTAYGTEALKPEGLLYVTWGGDVNQDGVVDFLDRNLTWNDRGSTGYLSTDCNGDNSTNAADDAIALANRLRIFQRP